jgi:eukaryotic-like serine/threonine-protein kinase
MTQPGPRDMPLDAALAIGAAIQVAGYEILRELGRGGMGVVYAARQTKLNRVVAVKVLPPSFANDPERRARFEREAKALAALTHPNILAIHDYGVEDGVPYAIMELLEGETLRQRLLSGALHWREAFALAAAVADGLAAAHAAGVVHRDLKPENLFLTADGRVKILDFGLARVEAPMFLQQETADYAPAQTKVGALMGTVGYMAPEQACGQPVDARSDLFSLGCVLYEIVAGRRAFGRATPADSLAAILSDAPPDMGKPGPRPPGEAERLILRCLEKKPENRFQSARDLAFALRAVRDAADETAASPPPRRCPPRQPKALDSLAVLPLVNAGADADMDYLSDGITESLIHQLSQLLGLRVMARSTVFRYKGRDVDAREAGRALKVRAVLTGWLHQRGGRLVLWTELIDVRDGARLWGEHYDRDLAELMAVEESIAREIAEALRLRLTGEQALRLGRRRTDHPDAYQLYLKGLFFLNKRTEEGLRTGARYFEEAIAIDPAYALAHAGRADCYHNLGGWGHLPPREAYPKAKAAATRALEIDATLAEAHTALAMAVKEYDWDWAAAQRGYRRAIALNPNYAVAHQWYGEYLAALGRHTEAIGEFQRAQELDPLSLIINATLGRHGFYFARRYDLAIEQCRKTLELDPNFWVAHYFLAWVYTAKGRLAEAVAAFEIARRLEPNLETLAGLGFAHGASCRRDKAEQALGELRATATTRYVSPINFALIHIGLAEKDAAFQWLEKAYQDRAQWLSEIKVDPAFDLLRPDPRFADLLARINFPPC